MSPQDFIVRELDQIKSEMSEIRKDVKKLLEFKWQIIGGSLAVSAIITLVLQMVIK